MKNFFARNNTKPAATPAVADAPPKPAPKAEALPPAVPTVPIPAPGRKSIDPTAAATNPDLFGGMAPRKKKGSVDPPKSNWSSRVSNDGSEASAAETATVPAATAPSGFSFIGATAPPPMTHSPTGSAGGTTTVIAARRKPGGKGGPNSPTNIVAPVAAPPQSTDSTEHSHQNINDDDEPHQPVQVPSPPPPTVTKSAFGFLSAPVAPVQAPPSDDEEREESEEKDSEKDSASEPDEPSPTPPTSITHHTNGTTPVSSPEQSAPQQITTASTRRKSEDPATRRKSDAVQPTAAPKDVPGHKAILAQRAQVTAAHEEVLKAIRAEAQTLNRKKVSTINAKSTSVEKKAALLEALKKAEADQLQCVMNEQYLQADTFNARIEEIKKELQAGERELDQFEKDIADLDQKLFDLCSKQTRRQDVYSSQLQDLAQSNERGLAAFSGDATQRYESAEERIREDMEKAKRAELGARVDLENLQQREQKLNDKIAEQTKEIRADLDARTREHKEVTDEIADLEAKLEMKRRLQNSLEVQIADLEHKVGQVRGDFAENLNRVESQISQDTIRLNDCKAVIAGLDGDRAANNVAKEAAEQEIALRRTIIDDAYAEAASIRTAVSTAQADLVQRKAQTQEHSMVKYTATHRTLLEAEKEIAQIDEGIHHSHSEIEQLNKKADSLAAQAQEAVKTIPELEAAKKVAVANRAFKDAQAKADQIRKLTEEKEKLDADAKTIRESVAVLESSVRLRSEELRQKSEDVATQRKRWVKEYHAALLRYQALTENLLTEPEMLDGQHEASRALLRWIQTVLNHLPQEDETPDSPVTVPAEQTKETEAPHDDGMDTDLAPAVGPENATQAPVQDTQEDEPPVPPQQPTRDPEEVRNEIADLEAQIQNHSEREEYDQCDALEERVKALKALLESS